MKKLYHKDCGGEIVSRWDYRGIGNGIAYINDKGKIDGICDSFIAWDDGDLDCFMCAECCHVWEEWINDPAEHPEIEIREEEE